MKAIVNVGLNKGVLDDQGKAINHQMIKKKQKKKLQKCVKNFLLIL